MCVHFEMDAIVGVEGVKLKYYGAKGNKDEK